MENQYFWPVFGMIWIFGWIFIAIIWHHLRSRRSERREERAHRERLAAIERGAESGSAGAEILPTAAVVEQKTSDPDAVRRASLGAGLVLIFLGLGMVTAFLIADADSLYDLWSLGFIPMFPGIGLVVYANVLADSADSE